MAYEDKTGLGVSAHYGARPTGGAEGVYKTEGSTNDVVLSVSLDKPLHDELIIPAGAIVWDYKVHGGASVTSLTVNAQNIALATAAIPVVIAAAGPVVLTPAATGGTVTFKYTYVTQ